MMKFLRFMKSAPVIFSTLFSVSPVLAELPNFEQVESVGVRFLQEHSVVAPNSATTVSAEFFLPDGWHIYWKNPGDSGLPAEFNVIGDNLSAKDILYPVPTRFTAFDIVGYGYKDKSVLKLPLHIGNIVGGEINADAFIEFLMCKDICIPGSLGKTLTWPVAEKSVPNQDVQNILSQYHYPETLQKNVYIQNLGNKYKITVQDTDIQKFFPYKNGMVDDTVLPKSENGSLIFKKDEWGDEPQFLSGLVVTTEGQAFSFANAPIEKSTGNDSINNSSVKTSFLVILGAAFLAGIILNLMPCVLPILALKVVSFARHDVKPHGISYIIGVLTGFWLIAAVVEGLRLTGQSVGWGFHLQNGSFVAFLSFIMLLIGLNMLSVFYVPMPKVLGQKRYADSGLGTFMTGLLAVVVATPCTVPFMGGAVAYALTQGGATSFAVFGALGLGLSLPYALLAYLPVTRFLFPKPGAWMETLKHILGFPLLATGLWLVWVYGGLTSFNEAFILLAVLLVWAFFLWLYGAYQHKGAYKGILFILVPALLTFYALKPTKEELTTLWQLWQKSAVEEALTQHPFVFVDVTADWCVTCKFTEATVLNRQKTQDLFQKYNVALFRADWTKEDPEITSLLNQFNRKGVPLYLIYQRDKFPKILSQLPSFDEIKAVLER